MAKETEMKQAVAGKLVLADGSEFTGTLYGKMTKGAEVVFTTSMFGAQETLTDAAYCNQIVVTSYPLNGNCGISPDGDESTYIWQQLAYGEENIKGSGKSYAAGFISSEICEHADNWRNDTEEKNMPFKCEDSLLEFLMARDIPVLTDVDTRAIVITIREKGEMKGIMVPAEVSREKALEMLEGENGQCGGNLIEKVSTKIPYVLKPTLDEGVEIITLEIEEEEEKAVNAVGSLAVDLSGNAAVGAVSGKEEYMDQLEEDGAAKYRVALWDMGVKNSLVKALLQRNCQLTIYPANTPCEVINGGDYDGVIIAGGPGNPEDAKEIIREIAKLPEETPVFAINLGHELLALARGGSVRKLPFGQRGDNHPVRNMQTGKISITSQNHSYVVEESGLRAKADVTERGVNGDLPAALWYDERPCFSLQYYPDTVLPLPGETDVFDRFMQMMGGRA